jgi:competence protein CoiA
MKYALVDGGRREAMPGLSGKCPDCAAAVVAKCGWVRDWHWAHWRTRDCDRWSEPETEWHRAWKNHFPESWQEISRRSDNGKMHRADVKTKSGVVLEFQHSFLRREEREAREMFYQNMVWVVHGLRKRAQFFVSLRAAVRVNSKLLILAVHSSECALLRDWEASRVPVYFDFGDSEPDETLRFNTPTLWRLTPCGRNSLAYLSPVSKAEFLRAHLEGLPFEEECTEAVNCALYPRAATQSQRLIGFERHWAMKQRARARPRF